jgi:hypothetical protein
MILDSISGARLRRTLVAIWFVITILFLMGLYLFKDTAYYSYIFPAYVAIMFGLTWELIMVKK